MLSRALPDGCFTETGQLKFTLWKQASAKYGYKKFKKYISQHSIERKEVFAGYDIVRFIENEAHPALVVYENVHATVVYRFLTRDTEYTIACHSSQISSHTSSSCFFSCNRKSQAFHKCLENAVVWYRFVSNMIHLLTNLFWSMLPTAKSSFKGSLCHAESKVLPEEVPGLPKVWKDEWPLLLWRVSPKLPPEQNWQIRLSRRGGLPIEQLGMFDQNPECRQRLVCQKGRSHNPRCLLLQHICFADVKLPGCWTITREHPKAPLV